MEERVQFVHDALSDRFAMSELCARYGVSRRVGYKWLARYETDGRRGLVDQSRAPKHCPRRTADRITELLVAFRQLHPQCGARKLTTACGRFTSTACCSRRSTNATTSSPADKSVTHPPGHFCYPSSRLFSHTTLRQHALASG